MSRPGTAAALLLAGAALLLVAPASPVRADPPDLKLQIEAGSELDTNPARLEAVEGAPVSAPAGVARGAARGVLSWRPHAGDLVRGKAVVAGKKFTGDAASEDVAVVTGDMSALHRLGDRPVAAGAEASYYEAFEADTIVAGRNVDRDFRTGQGALSLALLGEGGDRLTARGGYRLFVYKPDPAFDFRGEVAGLSYAHTFRVGDGPVEHTYDLLLEYTVNRRRYDTAAVTQVCPDVQDPRCRQTTMLRRRDLFHAAAAELVYTGDHILGARYELHVNDSNSFGESLLRHRLELSGTTDLFWNLVLTARVVAQLTQYRDGLLLTGDLGTFVTIEDENRNAVILHVTRELSKALTVEARYAFYTNEFASQAVRFRRHTMYLGVIYHL